jgi:hypothetical protein
VAASCIGASGPIRLRSGHLTDAATRHIAVAVHNPGGRRIKGTAEMDLRLCTLGVEISSSSVRSCGCPREWDLGARPPARQHRVLGRAT